ncbi:spermatogenesis- and oogenesis-specific basic helix-loop-helix-containing protein 1 [Cynocephalus volans]|uniref:spermatogenesis- and oogenesis-specific basic helix-loop-helix-containing protein 1 n=1 Tax=Cynocephalus volans TaxID=110931 RepID=UPI002FC5A9D4
MESPGLEIGVARAPASEGGCGSSQPGALSCWEDPAQGSGLVTAPPEAQSLGSGLPRNVISERERRKRISVSCERLRDLLPQFDGRREDMVSVLEMAVQYLRLAHALVPGHGRRTVLASSEETWQAWQKNVLQVVLSSQVPAGRPDSGTGVSGVTLQQDPLSCATPGMDEREGRSQLSEVLDRPSALPGQGPYNSFTWVSVGPWVCRKCGDVEGLGSVLVPQLTTSAFSCRQWHCFVLPCAPLQDTEPVSLAPWSPASSLSKVQRLPSLWPSYPRPLTSPDMSSSEAAPSWLGPAGPVGGAAAPVTGPAAESEGTLTPVLGDRSAWGSDVEDGTSLLTASPEWLLGSLESRGDGAPAWAPARSSSPDRAETNFVGDSQPASQELQDSPLEPWGSDAGRVGLSLRDEVDSLFPDFFAC